MTDARPSRIAAAFSEEMAWRIVVILSVIEIGAYVGNESGRYFWDLTEYVATLDLDNPYRTAGPYPFTYPPTAVDLFTLARSHLFELLSIAYVAVTALFLRTFALLRIRRRFEWLVAISAMGGLGVVSLQSGNVGAFMNLTVLALAFQAAMGKAIALRALPMVIGLGALIKPQFALYLGLLPFLERSVTRALAKMAAVGLSVLCVYAAYVVLRPDEWNEYVQAIVVERTMIEKDFAWGPAGFIKHFSDSNTAALVAFIAGFVVVGGLAYATWRSSRASLSSLALVCLAYVVLTFANPRLPVYDLFGAAIALSVCCSLANRPSTMAWTLVAALTINGIPWLIANFARVPSAYPWWLRDLQIAHLLGFGGLFLALSRDGIRRTSDTSAGQPSASSV